MEEPKKLSPNETLKEKSGYLRGTIAESLDSASSAFGKDDNLLLKFHGSYQQDDRDRRQQLLKDKQEPAYSMMVRTKVPGGKLTAEQYLVHDEMASLYGNGTLRITNRQGIQFHGILKKNMRAVMRAVNEKLVTTSGACGDIVRNVMGCTVPVRDRTQLEIFRYAKAVSDQFLSRSGAYQEIWLNGEKVDFGAKPMEEVEPIYGKTYLPRKFKIGICYPDDNSTDVYAQDLGIVPEVDAKGGLTGFNILVGGGFGTTHGVKTTYPRLGSPLCFVKPEDLLEITKAVVLVQRDNGNRADRKQARMKYLIDKMGLDWFRAEVEKRFGRKTEPAHAIRISGIHNYHGWHEQLDGRFYYGIFIENGRVKDEGTFRLKTALRTLVETYKPEVYLTGQQDAVLSGFKAEDRSGVEALLTAHGVKLPHQISSVRRDSMACPALPTCGLAITESERALPGIMDELEKVSASLGLDQQKFIIRMTGCPNGCARPYNAELAFIGRTVGTYDIHAGGNLIGDRLAKPVAEKVPHAELIGRLTPLFTAYRDERTQGEGFGDFCHRVGTDRVKALLTPALHA
ncbi:MAG: NADPH-dependent assimilatory sulfite reductase hemoprotein subunit [Candidatus Omnitrophica bacterium]|nr:NADPH-dependent assimilatory sulfite reductase hemoprotein subunit [Candidatus Omnitrophota bacterium]